MSELKEQPSVLVVEQPAEADEERTLDVDLLSQRKTGSADT